MQLTHSDFQNLKEPKHHESQQTLNGLILRAFALTQENHQLLT